LIEPLSAKQCGLRDNLPEFETSLVDIDAISVLPMRNTIFNDTTLVTSLAWKWHGMAWKSVFKALIMARTRPT